MERLPALTITLALGSRSRVFSAHELGAALALPALPGHLVALLLGSPCPHVVHEERGEGVREEFALPRNAERFQESLGKFYHPVCVLGREGVQGERRPPPADKTDALARYLADKLADPRSLAWYRKVARELPPELIRLALGRALELEPRDIRRSRGAMFTAIVNLRQPASFTATPQVPG